VNDNKELTERARAAYEHRRRDYGSVNENAIYFAASFAAIEREAAVREFVEKVRSDAALTNHFWIAAIEEAYREMFGKDL
jgi:hypothetical protein